jgi:hypothetical protein
LCSRKDLLKEEEQKVIFLYSKNTQILKEKKVVGNIGVV